MASQAEHVVAIDVGGTTMKGAVFDRQGRTWNETRRPTGTDRGAEAVIESILAFAGRLASPSPGPRAVGIAVPGLVRDSDGMVLEATNVGLRDVPLRELASRRLSSPVAVLHDVRAAALAEGTLGAARGRSDYLLLTLGTGVGAAVIIGGHPYTGAHGIGGELGHVAVDPRGPVCRCGGTGCLEAIASAGAVERRFGHGIDAQAVAHRAAAHEPAATRVWHEALDALALAIVNYATLLDPEVVVIGGGLANAGPRLFDPLSDLVRASTRFGKAVPIVPAALGEEAGCFGAAIAAWRAVGLDADWAQAPVHQESETRRQEPETRAAS
ncbi:MAG TPA: ROK family protein [Solirubrobacteraceae bacterium]|nr:ROK family protein [Solirubrobacteraceae bacterium]